MIFQGYSLLFIFVDTYYNNMLYIKYLPETLEI